jgi:hypothetical protein
MALQLSVAVRNAQLDAWETAIGVSPIFKLYDGANPASCAAAATAAEIASGVLPVDFSSLAAAGSKTILNGPFTVTGIAAAGAGTSALAYRIMDSTNTTCHEQGTVSVTAGGGDLTMDNTSVADAQVVNINTMTRTAGNA